LSEKGETPKEWFERRGKEFDLFTSSGSDIHSGGKGSSSKVENPFKTGNATEQGKLYKENPTLYTKLLEEHKAGK